MGNMNLLKGGFTGKVGEIYGERQHGKIFAKAVPFSHAPFNQAQLTQQMLFASLVRVAGGAARNFWAELGLSNRKMTRTNAITKRWKDMLIFERTPVDGWYNVYPREDALKFTALSFNPDTLIFHMEGENNPTLAGSTRNTACFFFVNDTLTPMGYIKTTTQNFVLDAQLAPLDFSMVGIMGFQSSIVKGKVIAHAGIADLWMQ